MKIDLMRLRPKTLGWLIIVYAGLTWIYFLQVQAMVLALIMNRRLPGGWYEGVGSVAWLVLLTGGIGLVRRKTWGRWMVVAATAFMIGVSLVLLMRAVTHLSSETSAFWPLLELEALKLLPELLILVAALRLVFPEADELPRPTASLLTSTPAAPDPNIRRLDTAYGMFAWIAIATTGIVVALMIPSTTTQGLGMLVGVPLVLSTLGAAVAGLVYSVKCFREWPLPVMSMLVVSMPIVVVLWEETVPTLFLTWMLIAVAALFFFCVRWYGVLRKRRMRETS